MELQVIDAKAKTWFINVGAYPMVDPTRKVHQDGPDSPTNWENFAFYPGIKYKIHGTAWMHSQPTILETDDSDDSVLALVLETPTQSSNLNLAPDATAANNAAKQDQNPKVIAKREAEYLAGLDEAAEREAEKARLAAEEAAKKAAKNKAKAKPATEPK